ncbi:UNVERIFIED_ORG: hypothetical protein J2Y84_002836 [Pseudomonas reinekei]
MGLALTIDFGHVAARRREASVHWQYHAIDEGRLRRGQEAYSVSDLFRFANAACRDTLASFLYLFMGPCYTQQVSVDRSWRYRIGRDAVLAKLKGHGPHQAQLARFHSAISRKLNRPSQSCDGGDEDNPSIAGGSHFLRTRLGQHINGTEAERHLRLQIRVAHVQERLGLTSSRVADQYIDATVLVAEPIDASLHSGVINYVETQSGSLMAKSLKLTREIASGAAVKIRHNYMSSILGKTLRDRAANAPGGAGNQRDLSY